MKKTVETKPATPAKRTRTPKPPTPVSSNPDALLRLPQVLELVPVGASTWWSWVKTGRAPDSVKLGARTTTWRRGDIDRFIEDQSFLNGK